MVVDGWETALRTEGRGIGGVEEIGTSLDIVIFVVVDNNGGEENEHYINVGRDAGYGRRRRPQPGNLRETKGGGRTDGCGTVEDHRRVNDRVLDGQVKVEQTNSGGLSTTTKKSTSGQVKGQA